MRTYRSTLALAAVLSIAIAPAISFAHDPSNSTSASQESKLTGRRYDFSATPLRSAIVAILEGSRVQVRLAPGIPDTPITVQLWRMGSPEDALRELVRIASSREHPLELHVVSRRADVEIYEIAPPGAETHLDSEALVAQKPDGVGGPLKFGDRMHAVQPDDSQPPKSPEIKPGDPNEKVLDPSTRRVTIDYKGVTLRSALETSFNTVQAGYTLPSNLPDSVVTLVMKDAPFDDVLKRLLTAGSTPTVRLTYRKETSGRGSAPVYEIVAIPIAPPDVERITGTLAVTFVSASELVRQINGIVPEIDRMDAMSANNSIFYAGTQNGLQHLREIVRLLDIAPAGIVAKFEVVMVQPSSGKNRSMLMDSSLIGVNNQVASTTTRADGPPSRASKLTVRMTPHVLGNGEVSADLHVEISVPLSTPNKGEVLRLDKEIDTIKRLKPGDTMIIGGTTLDQFGMKGQILIFLTVTLDQPQH